MFLMYEDYLKHRRYVIVQLPNNELQTETVLKGSFLSKQQAELALKVKDQSYEYEVRETFNFKEH